MLARVEFKRAANACASHASHSLLSFCLISRFQFGYLLQTGGNTMRRTCALLVVAFAVLGGFAGIAADYGVPGGGC